MPDLGKFRAKKWAVLKALEERQIEIKMPSKIFRINNLFAGLRQILGNFFPALKELQDEQIKFKAPFNIFRIDKDFWSTPGLKFGCLKRAWGETN